MDDITKLLERAREDGFTHNLSYDNGHLYCADTDERFAEADSWIVDMRSVDMGTDPGDDSTLYLIETRSGRKGYIIVPTSFYTEPEKADFIDRLRARDRPAGPDV